MMIITHGDARENALLGNEQGTAIITVLLILMLLTFIGITSTRTTVTEKAVIRSDAVFERSFYLAESAALEGIQKLANESTPEELLAPLITAASNNDGLLISADAQQPENDLANCDSNGDGDIDGNDIPDVCVLDPDNTTRRLVVQLPISSGSSLGLGSSRLYSYASYGLTEAQGGRSMIKIGYKKRF